MASPLFSSGNGNSGVSSVVPISSGDDKNAANWHLATSEAQCFGGRKVDAGHENSDKAEKKPLRENRESTVGSDLEERSVTAAFKPFPSIELSDSKYYIEQVLKHNPEIEKAGFVVTEKLDGSNITVMITAAGNSYFSREKQITLNEVGFAGVEKLSDYLDDFERIRKTLADRGCNCISIRGELYGPGINKRIDYGDEIRYDAFMVELDEKALPHCEFTRFMAEMEFQKLTPVPVLCSEISLSEALAFDTETPLSCRRGEEQSNTKLSKHMEGVVIQPCDRLAIMHYKDGSEKAFSFLLKKKSGKYKEIEHKGARSGKVKKESKPLCQEERGFLDYINENRLKSVCSQYGQIQSATQIGQYIRRLLNDAETDFLKQYPDVKLSSEARKQASHCAAQTLKETYPEIFIKDKNILKDVKEPVS